MRLFKYTCLFIGLMVFFRAEAQEIEPIRLELPVQLESKSYRYQLLGEQGVLLFYESRELDEAGKRKWYFSLLDTNLTERWMRFMALNDGMRVERIVASKDRLAVILLNTKSKKQDPVQYEIVSFSIETSKFGLLGGNFPAKSEVAAASLSGDQLLIGLNLDDYLADFLLFDLKLGALNALDSNLDGQLLITEMATSNTSGDFIVSVKQFENKRFIADVFLVFDSGGSLLRQYKPEIGQAGFLASVGFAFFEDDIIVLGTFERENKRPAALKDVSGNQEREAVGLFYLQLHPDGSLQSQFYNFNQVPNIDVALAREDLMRLRQQQSRGKTQEQTEISFQFYKPIILKQDSQLVFAAEAYRPQYRVESRIDYDFYGRPIPYTYTLFEGYNFFNTLIVSFDKNGQIQWVNSFRMQDLLSFNRDYHVMLTREQDEFLAALFNEGSIQNKTLQFDGTSPGVMDKVIPDLKFPNDRLLDDSFSRIHHWYDSYYLLTGNQKISNNRLRIENPRSVFFMQKLVFE